MVARLDFGKHHATPRSWVVLSSFVARVFAGRVAEIFVLRGVRLDIESSPWNWYTLLAHSSKPNTHAVGLNLGQPFPATCPCRDPEPPRICCPLMRPILIRAVLLPEWRTVLVKHSCTKRKITSSISGENRSKCSPGGGYLIQCLVRVTFGETLHIILKCGGQTGLV